MSVQTELDRLNAAKNSLKTAIEGKGVAVPDGTKIDGYGALVEQISGAASPVIEPLEVTENGTYTAPAGVDGYSPVTVNVSGGGGEDAILQFISGEVHNFSTTELVGAGQWSPFTNYGFEGYLDLVELKSPIQVDLSTGALNFINEMYFYYSLVHKVDLYNVVGLNADAFSFNPSLDTFILRTEITDPALVEMLGGNICVLVDASAFTSTSIESGKGYIYVPKKLVDSYKTAPNWSVYADQIRAIEDYPEITGGAL